MGSAPHFTESFLSFPFSTVSERCVVACFPLELPGFGHSCSGSEYLLPHGRCLEAGGIEPASGQGAAGSCRPSCHASGRECAEIKEGNEEAGSCQT